jgi:hypothetical protein
MCRRMGRRYQTPRARYSVCVEWLTRSGLAVEADKTELLFFQKPYEHNPMPAPTRLILPQPEINSYFTVQPVDTLRYLGFFINRRLKWEPHVRIMCNRARASIKALQVLGNSICRLSMANWRLVLNAVCLPVMTWGCQLWFRQGGTKRPCQEPATSPKRNGQSRHRLLPHGAKRNPPPNHADVTHASLP